MQPDRLFHISEDSDIKVFEPRPSPSYFESIKGDVVFAVTDRLLHNYLLPRDCPRVAFYAKSDTTQQDKERYVGATTADFIIAVESVWYSVIKQTKLFCYEFPIDSFVELDAGAGYYISYKRVVPYSIRQIDDLMGELLRRNVELRIMPTLWKIAQEVSQSTLQYSLIRMRNAMREKE